MRSLRTFSRRIADSIAYRRTEAQEARILQQVRPYSMVPAAGIRFVIETTRRVLKQEITGDFVECGVWMGGCSAAMRLSQQAFFPNLPARPIHLFDSFEGLPPAQAVDGQKALDWQANPHDSTYFDNCTASLEQVQSNLQVLNLLDSSLHFHKGWFETTIPAFVQANPTIQISLLRLDGDWYESTKVCIENLYDRVAQGGIILIDDYYAWSGCTQAIHEFLANNHLTHPIRSIPRFTGAYFIKEEI